MVVATTTLEQQQLATRPARPRAPKTDTNGYPGAQPARLRELTLEGNGVGDATAAAPRSSVVRARRAQGKEGRDVGRADRGAGERGVEAPG